MINISEFYIMPLPGWHDYRYALHLTAQIGHVSLAEPSPIDWGEFCWGRVLSKDASRASHDSETVPADVKVLLRYAAAMSISHLRYENRTCEVQAADAYSKRICDFETHLRPSLRRCDFHIAGVISKRRCSEVGVLGKWQAVIPVTIWLLESHICFDSTLNS